MSIQKMISIIKQLHHDSNTNPNILGKRKKKYMATLVEKHPALVKKYSSIFYMLEHEDIDNEKINRLHYMLQMALNVERGTVDSKDADVTVGQVLVDKIVKPQIERVRNDKKNNDTNDDNI
tara:strand:- start:2109 stop:2471 length:363 start_codon:yes stop_codon:yes gene_type:complete